MADAKPWNEIAATLPSELSDQQFNQARRHYFDQVVRPKLSKQDNPTAAWTEFDKLTQRPKATAAQRAGAFVTGSAAGLLQPLKLVSPRGVKPIEDVATELSKKAPGFGGVGRFVGETGAFVATAELLPELGEGKLAQHAKNILAFGAFEAASAEQGNRLTAGARGMAIGAAWEGSLGLLGKLLKRGVSQKEIDQIVTKAMTGEGLEADLDKVVAEEVKKSADASRKEMRPGSIVSDPHSKGLQVFLRDKDGKPMPAMKIVEGKEQQAIDQIKELTDNGASVDVIKHHPEQQARVQKFLRLTADQSKGSYEGFKVITVEDPKKAAQVLQQNDIPATVVSPTEVVVKTDTVQKPKPQRVAEAITGLRDEEGEPLTKGSQLQISRQIAALWDEHTPAQNKDAVARMLRPWSNQLKEVIPPEFVLEPEVGEKVAESLPSAEPTQSAAEALKSHPNLQRPIAQDIIARAQELGMSEAELTRLYEIAGRTKETGVGAQHSVMEEAIRKGELPEIMQFVPASERDMVTQGEVVKDIQVGETERRYSIRAPEELIEAALPRSYAFTAGPANEKVYARGFKSGVQSVANWLGLDPENFKALDDPNKPTIIYPPNVSRTTTYHENLHVDKYHVPEGEEIIRGTKLADQKTLNQLKTYLSMTYKKSNESQLAEEAFVHAASALRTGDVSYLTTLARYDTSIEHVAEFVQKVAEGLLEAARSIDSAPARVVQRKMEDLIRRTSPDRMWEFKDAVKQIGDLFPTPGEGWTFVDHSGAQQSFSGSTKEAVDFIEKQLGEDHAPSFSTWAEMRGVRGPMGPRGSEPTRDPSGLPTHPDNVKWSGWTTISGMFRPFFPWVADVDTRINEALSKTGRKLPLYERAKDVDDAFRTRMVMEDQMRETTGKLLKGLGKKQYDVFQLLSTEQQHWPEMQRRLALTDEQVAKARELSNWFLNDYKAATGYNPLNYMLDEYPRLKGFGYNTERVYGNLDKTLPQMSFFERGIKTGKLDPKSGHLGSFVDFLIRQGLSEKYTDKAINELESIVNKKAKDGSYILGNMRLPFTNYTRYMRGIPDVTGQVMQRTVKDFAGFIADKSKVLNKHLPSWAQLPEEYPYAGSVINKAMVWSYAAGLGLRASIPVRDTLQVLSTGLPIMGVKRFALGLEKGLTREGFEFARDSGALLTRHNIGELYGDIFNELPVGASQDQITQLAQKLLSPSRWGHNGARTVMFNGEYHSALEAINEYRAGRIDLNELIKDRTSLWWNDKPVIDRIMGQIHDPSVPPEVAAKKIALETLDLTLWPYRRGTQPTLLRTGAGRIFGQFGMWPMNYLDFLRRGAQKYAEYPGNALRATALWSAANYAAVSSMEAIGADSGKWFWVSPAGYGLSPHAQFVLNLGKMWEETPDGRQARKEVLEYPLDFMPTSLELQNIYKVWDSGEAPFDDNGHPTPALLQILGFKPAKEEPDRDFEEQLRYEFGMEGRRR